MKTLKKIFSVLISITFMFLPPVSLSGCKSDTPPDNTVAFNAPYFTIDILSTGKSDFILIRMDDIVIVNDAADEDDYDAIREILNNYGITEIDYLIISHFDNDHIGSAAPLIDDYKIGQVFAPNYLRTSRLYWTMVGALDNVGMSLTTLTEDISIETAHGGFDINVPAESTYDDENNYSLITTIRYSGHRFLLTGDAMKIRITEFLSLCEGKYDLIKLPHHGDGNKSLFELIEKITPKYAIVTVEDSQSIEKSLTATLDTNKVQLFETFTGSVHINISGGVINVDYAAKQ